MSSTYRTWEVRPVRRRDRYASFAAAIPLAAGLHLLLVLALTVPAPQQDAAPGAFLVVLEASPALEIGPFPVPAEPPAVVGQAGEGMASLASARSAETLNEPRIPASSTSQAGAPYRTISSAALRALRGAILPLVIKPGGIGRRGVEVDARRLAVMRAESLLNFRLGTLPGAQRRPRGPGGLAEGGGVTMAIPWGGFLPRNRGDEVWRAERCQKRGDGEDDKPGEAEARRSQCG